MLKLLSLLLASTTSVWADTYTFPAKSVNLDAAYKTDFFEAHTLETQITPATDAHAVDGIELADGGYLLTGKAMESDGSSITEAFAVKLSATGTIVWGWKSGVSGKDASNAAAQLPNGEVLIAGYRNVGGILKRSITKLNQATGAEIWTATDFGDNAANSNGAFEMINVDATHGAILAGFHQKPDQSEMHFKSYGNVGSGAAIVMTIPNAALEAATAPTSAQVTRTKIYAGYNTAKTAHFASATQAAVLLYKDEVNKHASFAVMNPATGADVVAVVDLGSVIGEGTDMQLVGTTHAVIVGQGKPTGMTVGYSGKLTKVALSDGSRVWTKEYSSCGAGTVAGAPAAGECSKGLIFNECWGVAVMADGGFAISCGTGIENCNAMSGAMLTACTAGLGDKRAGAYPRKASVWDAMTVKTDSAGTLKWMRTDSYKAASWPALTEGGTLPTQSQTTAGEWPIRGNSGTSIAIVTDQISGVGLLKMSVGNSSSPPGNAPTVAPTAAPTAATPASADSSGLGVGWVVLIVATVLVIVAVGAYFMCKSPSKDAVSKMEEV